VGTADAMVTCEVTEHPVAETVTDGDYFFSASAGMNFCSASHASD
jgi:hypothetical protein